jgi:hypothetical protein
VRHVIYFLPLGKSQTMNRPKDKNNIQFIPLNELEEQGKNAQIGLLKIFFRILFIGNICLFR